MKVRLKDSIDREKSNLVLWLKKDKEYVVLAIEGYGGGTASYRIASEDGTPVLFKAELFEITNRQLARSWVVQGLEQNVLKIGPQEFGRLGFWEEFFDGEPGAEATYAVVKSRILEESC